MNATEAEALAKKRFFALTLIRLSGVVMVLVGLLCALDKIDIPGAHLIGVILVVVGMVDFFVMPKMLSRRWRSPDA